VDEARRRKCPRTQLEAVGWLKESVAVYDRPTDADAVQDLEAAMSRICMTLPFSSAIPHDLAAGLAEFLGRTKGSLGNQAPCYRADEDRRKVKWE
jgi:hypothetical protein